METNLTSLTSEQLLPYSTAANGTMAMWPAIGVMATLLFASFHFENPVLIGVAIGVYVIGVFVAVGVQAKRTGVQPSFGSMPVEIKSNLYRFWAGSTVLAVAGMALAFATNFLVAGIVIGLGITAIGMLYHQRSRAVINGLMANA